MTKLRLDILEQAKAIRDSMNKVTENLTDEQAVEVMELYLPWVVGEASTRFPFSSRGVPRAV